MLNGYDILIPFKLDMKFENLKCYFLYLSYNCCHVIQAYVITQGLNRKHFNINLCQLFFSK